MEKLILNNNEYVASEIVTINPPMNKVNEQKRKGITVVGGYGKLPTIKALKYATTNPKFTCIIYYGYPKSKFIQDILNAATYENKDVYYKVQDSVFVYTATEPKPTARDKYIAKQEYKQQAHTARLEHLEYIYQGQRVTEEQKNKMKRYIKYYELELPESEIEWVEMLHQLRYYIKNKLICEEPEYTSEEQALIDSYQMEKDMTYGFDTNRYYICEECGELVLRNTEHTCYYDEPIKRTKLDYIVNGGE